jgi:hypothetical protein
VGICSSPGVEPSAVRTTVTISFAGRTSWLVHQVHYDEMIIFISGISSYAFVNIEIGLLSPMRSSSFGSPNSTSRKKLLLPSLAVYNTFSLNRSVILPLTYTPCLYTLDVNRQYAVGLKSAEPAL